VRENSEEKKKMLYIRLDMVNKKQYEESMMYKNIKIIIPKPLEDLKKDFEYLDLDYENYTIQDTHIKECEFIDKESPAFSADISTAMNKLIARASDSGYTTPFQDMKKFYGIIKNFDYYERDKLLAIMEVKQEQITNIKDAIKFAQNINCFNLTEAYDNEELARRLIYEGEIDMEDLMDYADLERLGEEYSEDKNMIHTQYGFLNQECDFKEEISQKEEDEEFE
jgi:hypothetical protein